jgi:hypothetical protein
MLTYFKLDVQGDAAGGLGVHSDIEVVLHEELHIPVDYGVLVGYFVRL